MKFTVVMIIVFLIMVGSSYAMDLKGLVLYLPFNDGSGTIAKDYSGNKLDATLKGKVEWVNGKFGKAVRVDAGAAENFVTVKANKLFDVTDQITFGAWVNIELMPDNHCSLITKADTYMIHMSDWSGKGIEMEPLLWPFDAWQTPVSTPIPLKEWHHVIGVFDGKELKTYLDGALKGKRTFASKIAVTTNDLVLGRDSRGCCVTRKAAMNIDDAVLFSRALTDAEVKELTTVSLTPVQPEDHLSTLWGKIKSE